MAGFELTIIYAENVLCGANARPLRCKIEINDTSITSVELWDVDEPTASGSVVFPSRYLVTPAFIDSHTHCAMSFFRRLPVMAWTERDVVADLFLALKST